MDSRNFYQYEENVICPSVSKLNSHNHTCQSRRMDDNNVYSSGVSNAHVQATVLYNTFVYLTLSEPYTGRYLSTFSDEPK